MINRARLCLILALTAIIAVIAAPRPATAAASDCPVNYFCIWPNYDFTGTRWQYAYSTFVNSTHNNGIRLNSTVSNHGRAFYNRTGTQVNIYDDATCNVNYWWRGMVNGQAATAAGSDWGDRVSSLQLWNAQPLRC